MYTLGFSPSCYISRTSTWPLHTFAQKAQSSCQLLSEQENYGTLIIFFLINSHSTPHHIIVSPLTAVPPPRCITPPSHHSITLHVPCLPSNSSSVPSVPSHPSHTHRALHHNLSTPIILQLTPPQSSWLPPDSHLSFFHPPAQWKTSTSYAWLVPGVPAAQWRTTCQAPSQAPSSLSRQEGERNKAKHSLICDNRTWQRPNYYTVLQEKQRKKCNHKSKIHHLIHISNLLSLPTRALR